MENSMSEDEKEVQRYITAIVDAIFEAAPKGDVNDVGTRPVIVVRHTLTALVSVQAYILASTDKRSGTPEALKRSVGGYTKALSRWTREIQERPESNPFKANAVHMNMLPYTEGTPQ